MSHSLIKQSGQAQFATASDGSLNISVPIRLGRRECHTVIKRTDGSAFVPAHDATPTTLQLCLARAFRYQQMIDSGQMKTLGEIAKAESVDKAYLSRLASFTTLAPDIVAAILDDTLPPHVTFFNLTSGTPMLWDEQRALVWSRTSSDCSAS